jgi:hypothetical protein
MTDVFADFNGRYSHSSEFPEQAVKVIPPWLLTAIDNGNEEFFADFATAVPKLYERLVRKSGRVHLL